MFLINKIRHSREHVVLITAIIISTLFISLFIVKLSEAYYANNQKSDAMSENAIHFLVEPKNYIDFSGLLEYEEKDYMLLAKQSDVQPVYQVICGNVAWSLMDGRNFTNDDFYNGIRSAVIGSDVDKIMQTAPLIIKEKEYNLIGKRKASIDLLSKYAVLYSEGNISEILSDNEFLIESSSVKKGTLVLNKITEQLKEQGFRIKVIKTVKPTINDFIKIESRWVNFMILFVIIYCTLNFSVLLFWLLGYQEQAYVYKLLGVVTIRKEIHMQFIKIFTMAYLFDGMVCLFITENKIMLLPFLVVVYFILLFFMTLALAVELEILIHRKWLRSSL